MTTQNSFMNLPEEFNSQDAYELALRTLRKYIFAGKQSDTIDGICATIWSVCKSNNHLSYSEYEVMEQVRNTLNVIMLRKDVEHAYVFYLVFGMSIANGILCDILSGNTKVVSVSGDRILYGEDYNKEAEV